MKAIDCWIGVAGGTFERNRVILKTYLQQFVNLKRIVIFLMLVPLRWILKVVTAELSTV